MDSLRSLLEGALAQSRFLRLVLSQPPHRDRNGFNKVTVRSIQSGGTASYQWAARYGNQERHENLSQNELLAKVDGVFGVSLLDARLFTSDSDITIKQLDNGKLKIKRSPATLKADESSGHNREKQYLIPVGRPCPFLVEIGVMLPDGRVRPAMYHKFRQINRYLEFVDDILEKLPAEGTLNVVDFGCGKSYLTFALHHLLTVLRRRTVSIVGLDLKEDVVADCNRIAVKLGCNGLRFEVGRIESFSPSGPIHLAVSLHACDTATDDALAAAIHWGCDAILAVPCCQHELNRILNAPALDGLTEYGLFRDRFASLATDALRARLLEVHGYRTQVLEFIDMEHTPKNVLLRATRRSTTDPATDATRRTSYEKLKAELGILTWHLEQALARQPLLELASKTTTFAADQ